MGQKKNNNSQEQIKVKSLSVTYFPGQSNEVKSLDDINFSIQEGEFIIFFGPSGCGKSTLLYSIAGLEKFAGNVWVDGKDIKQLSNQEKVDYSRKKIGMVFQAYHLIPTLNVFQNVSLPLIAAKIKSVNREKRVMELLSRFGVSIQARRLPNQLSGGQQQRVAICRAVVNDPDILLVDEPLGNLDSKSAAEVVKLFKDINSRLKKTVILVTHDPTYLDIAHRVFFIKDGRLIDIKVNRDINQDVELSQEFASNNHVKELDFLSSHYSPLKESGADSLMRAFKAKNLSTLALTGFSVEEFDAFRGKVEQSLKENDDFKRVERFLDVNQEDGGLGLDIRTAKKITKQLRALFEEFKISEDLPKTNSTNINSQEVREEEESDTKAMRRAIFDELNVNLEDIQSLRIIDEAILNRMRGKIDVKELNLILDKPLEQGGASLDKRLVRKIIKRLEIWLMGHK